ncbi:MAG: prepilin-type N-terminal cleavage/methylation domain-containing protein [Candidatus Omnitrophica bacterium]|nr:hypothetical protein [bacterium]NUN96906.1 prepilin-type N-terminal cleavage/methylation domain-containing protein [Candidatus Omnitrophota bacterium]
MPSHRTHNARQAPGGFTLIELVVVVAILSLMVGTAIPLFGGALGKLRATSAIDEVLMTLRLANQKSVFQQARQEFVIDFRRDKNRYWIEFLQPGKRAKKLRWAPDQVRALKRDFEFIQVYFPDQDETNRRRQARISFFPDGTSKDCYIFLGKSVGSGGRDYDPLYVIEVRGSDGRVRLLEGEEKEEYEGYL